MTSGEGRQWTDESGYTWFDSPGALAAATLLTSHSLNCLTLFFQPLTSADGWRYWWDGTQWQPYLQATAPGPAAAAEAESQLPSTALSVPEAATAVAEPAAPEMVRAAAEPAAAPAVAAAEDETTAADVATVAGGAHRAVAAASPEQATAADGTWPASAPQAVEVDHSASTVAATTTFGTAAAWPFPEAPGAVASDADLADSFRAELGQPLEAQAVATAACPAAPMGAEGLATEHAAQQPPAVQQQLGAQGPTLFALLNQPPEPQPPVHGLPVQPTWMLQQAPAPPEPAAASSTAQPQGPPSTGLAAQPWQPLQPLPIGQTATAVAAEPWPVAEVPAVPEPASSAQQQPWLPQGPASVGHAPASAQPWVTLADVQAAAAVAPPSQLQPWDPQLAGPSAQPFVPAAPFGGPTAQLFQPATVGSSDGTTSRGWGAPVMAEAAGRSPHGRPAGMIAKLLFGGRLLVATPEGEGGRWRVAGGGWRLAELLPPQEFCRTLLTPWLDLHPAPPPPCR